LKEFKGFTAVRNVDLTIRAGSVHALIGPNGAGKTTVFNLLTKFLEPSGGTIRYRGRDITTEKPAAIARMGLIRSFQISAVFQDSSVRQNIRIALQRLHAWDRQFWRSDTVLRRFDERAEQLAHDVGLADHLEERAGNLSYGRRRALELATTLALEPEVILLDEPMAGMGREDIGRITELIRRVARGRTVVMVEHNLTVVADICDFVTVLQRGEVLTEGAYADVSADPRVRRAYLGEDHD